MFFFLLVKSLIDVAHILRTGHKSEVYMKFHAHNAPVPITQPRKKKHSLYPETLPASSWGSYQHVDFSPICRLSLQTLCRSKQIPHASWNLMIASYFFGHIYDIVIILSTPDGHLGSLKLWTFLKSADTGSCVHLLVNSSRVLIARIHRRRKKPCAKPWGDTVKHLPKVGLLSVTILIWEEFGRIKEEESY